VALVFDRGDAVLYRELWGDAVMTALPLRVVSDTPERTVLYLAPNTAFRGARAPDGGRVRDLDGWVSTDVVWIGGSLIRLVEPGAWHCVDVEFDADRCFAGWYVNFQEPMRRTPAGFDTVDLVLDLVVAPDGACSRKDEEDFAKAVADGHIAADAAEQVLADAERMTSVMTDEARPFGERHWLTWRPPSEWSVPVLPAGWDRPPSV
jgi:hypothetical protein